LVVWWAQIERLAVDSLQPEINVRFSHLNSPVRVPKLASP